MLKLNSPEYKGGEYAALMLVGARQTIVNDFMIKGVKGKPQHKKSSQIESNAESLAA